MFHCVVYTVFYTKSVPAAYGGIFSHTVQADVLPVDKMIDSKLNVMSVCHYVSHVRKIPRHSL
jgi:hypothetical protein